MYGLFRFLRLGRIMGRGDFRYVLLEALKDRPMHGYELMKTVGEKFSGFYMPSAGVIYPTLQLLEDQGFVKVISDEGKRVFAVTDEGLRFLKAKRSEAEAALKRCEDFFTEDRLLLFNELRRFAVTLFLNFEELTPEKTRRVAEIVKEARVKVSELAEGE